MRSVGSSPPFAAFAQNLVGSFIDFPTEFVFPFTRSRIYKHAAAVAEVSVDLESGRVVPKRFTVALDCGPISNPDGLRNQTEGGILQGTSRALLEEVTWDSKRVTSTDWSSYNSLYLDLEVPAIDITLINRADVPATGAGETAITLVPAAIGNAIFDATGVRLREVPFTAQRVQAALRTGNIDDRLRGSSQARPK